MGLKRSRVVLAFFGLNRSAIAKHLPLRSVRRGSIVSSVAGFHLNHADRLTGPTNRVLTGA